MDDESSKYALIELIDTLWNVNNAFAIAPNVPVYELIDTLWNVNKVAVAELKNDIWINRYIMECKWCRVKRVANDGYELIDTLWNVNKLGDSLKNRLF